jgi:hypothetical protein
MSRDIDNSQDILDSRDIIARIEELEDGRDDFNADNEEMETPPTWEEENPEDAEELENLIALQDELKGYCPDWEYGVVLVRESYWVDYVEELLEDIGDLPKDIPHYIAIDWDKTADNIQTDYTSADFDGVTYWAR